MKNVFLLLAVAVLFSSCHDYWAQEDKDVYHKTCMDDAKIWAATEADAKTYCDCVLEKVTTKYSTVDELLKHMHEIGADADIQKCKEGIPVATP